MDSRRREVLRTGGGVTLLTLVAAAGWLKPSAAMAQAWNKAAFATKTMDDTMKALGGGAPVQSKDIAFVSTPDIAENGAVVPIGINSKIPNTEVDRDPDREEPEHAGGDFDIPGGHRARRSRRASRWARPRTSTRWSRPTASTTWRRRKSRSRSAAAAADAPRTCTRPVHKRNGNGRSDENPRDAASAIRPK